MRDLIAQIAGDLELSEEERRQELPSGGTSVIASRVSWAKTYLKKAGLVVQPKRSMVEATARGRELLATNLPDINNAVLLRYPEYRAFKERTATSPRDTSIPTADPILTEPSSTPDDQITSASKALDEDLRDALLARVLEGTRANFEKVILDLLLAMGYGGSRADAGERLGGTGDGGVDGVIREDPLGLDRVYLQAKRYQPANTVGSEAVQAFIGALVGKGAQKGVFITTSTFSKSAKNAAVQSGHLRLVLIDGDELTRLLARYNVGVRTARTIELKTVDLAYFDDLEPE